MLIQKIDYEEQDYEELKNQSKFFAVLSQKSFLQMALRLKIINDNELYKLDGNKTFEEFLSKEIPVHRSTIFTYLSIVNTFGIELLLETGNIDFNYSKARPFLPILNSDKINDDEKNELKKTIIEDMKTKSAREMQQEAKKKKEDYSIDEENKKSRNVTTTTEIIEKFQTSLLKLPDTLSRTDIIELKKIYSSISIIIDQNKNKAGGIDNWKESYERHVKEVEVGLEMLRK